MYYFIYNRFINNFLKIKIYRHEPIELEESKELYQRQRFLVKVPQIQSQRR